MSPGDRFMELWAEWFLSTLPNEKEKQMFTFNIKIGDWSGDGHGKQQTFTASSNKNIIEVREAFFAACKKHPGIAPTEFMCNYEDYSLPKEIYEEALEAGFDFLAGVRQDKDFQERLKSGEYFEYPDFGPDRMFEYTLWFTKLGDPELVLEKVEVPSLAFYGFDQQKRHIGFIGYGLMGN